jgi:CRISPR-associated helicase Cas3
MIQLSAEQLLTYKVPFIGNKNPYAHQAVQRVLIQKAMDEKKQVIIWNQAMTGAGKTLANYSYLVGDKKQKAIGIYPVNELVKDQFSSIDENLPLGKWDEIAVWTSEVLTHKRQSGESKVEQLKRLMSKYHRIVLSNPDHLMLIAQERFYNFKKGERTLLFYQLLEYNLQIFDEFHLYNIAQMNFLAQWMALMIASAPNKPFVFVLSSATPKQSFFDLARGIGLEIWNVQEEVTKWLASEQPVVDQERTFLQAVQLEVKPSLLHQWETADKILADWAEVETYLEKYPKAKGLIILDSIHEAQTLAYRLRSKGYDVGEVHGLSDRLKSRDALSKQLTVATSTIEVGVDFQGDIHKDFLLFEARDAGSFIQRLGRIGRGHHPEAIAPIQVWAYVPYHVADTIQQHASTQMLRSELQQHVVSSYQYYQEFLPYVYKVGGMNLVHHRKLLAGHQIERENAEVLVIIEQILENMYQEGWGSHNERYRKWQQQKVLEPVIHFRGQNSMEAYHYRHWDGTLAKEELETFYPDLWFWDETAPQSPLKRYDVQFVLRRRHVYFITKEEMIEKVSRYYQGVEREDYIKALKQDYVLGYAVATGVRDKPAKLYWRLPIQASRLKEQIVRIRDVKLESSEPELKEQLIPLFNFRERKSFIAMMIPHSAHQVRLDLHLPPMFRLFQAKLRSGADWSIAFNSEAFQLWSIWNTKDSIIQ